MPELMDGVTLLNTVPAEQPLNIWICIAVGALCGALVSFMFSIIEKPDFSEFVFAAVCFSIIGCIGGSFFCAANNFSLAPERYEVIVSDDVSMNEFIERYEIVEKNGQIYTIEVKTE